MEGSFSSSGADLFNETMAETVRIEKAWAVLGTKGLQ